MLYVSEAPDARHELPTRQDIHARTKARVQASLLVGKREPTRPLPPLAVSR